MARGRGDRAVENLQQRGFSGTIRSDDAETIARADQPCHVVENLTTGDGDFLRRRRYLQLLRFRRSLRCGNFRFDNSRLFRRLRSLQRDLHGRSRGSHAGIDQTRVGEIVDRHFHGSVHLRFGVHCRNHVDARCGGFHLGHVGIVIGFSLHMFENLRHINQIDHLLTKTGSGHLLQFQRISHRWHIGDELARGLHMELLFGGTRASAAGQPGQFLAGQVAAFRFSHVRLAVAFDALQHVCGVAAFEWFDYAVVHFPHRFADFVEEPAVVGDEQQCAGACRPAVFQVFGQPVDCDDVQVVGGLVEGQNVPVFEQ